MTEANKLPYRNGVGVMLINKDNLVFVAKRIDSPSEAWQMPQGGIDNGEAPVEALYRELEEEVGISKDLVEIITQSKETYTYDLPDFLVGKLWNGKYCGQRQSWFALRFLGDDSDINIFHTHLPEFCEWKWAAIDDLLDLVVPFKHETYQALIEEFKPSIFK